MVVEDINIGDMIRYSGSSYIAYCYDTDCADGVATLSAGLEECWWDDEFWAEWDKKHNPERYKKYYKEKNNETIN